MYFNECNYLLNKNPIKTTKYLLLFLRVPKILPGWGHDL